MDDELFDVLSGKKNFVGPEGLCIGGFFLSDAEYWLDEDGKLHREDGPAITMFDQNTHRVYYYFLKHGDITTFRREIGSI